MIISQNTKVARLLTLKDIYKGKTFNDFIFVRERCSRSAIIHQITSELNHQMLKAIKGDNVRYRQGRIKSEI